MNEPLSAGGDDVLVCLASGAVMAMGWAADTGRVQRSRIWHQ